VPAPPVRSDRTNTDTEGWWARHDVTARLVYWGLHLTCLLVFWVGVTPGDVLLFLATYYGRMFGITGGYHRYFAHKTYRTSRVFQLLLAVLGSAATQKGPLWWAGNHRIHHKYADRSGRDPHSPADGFYWSHQGWIFEGRWDATRVEQIPEFARYPELRWLNRNHIVAPILLAGLCAALGGVSGVLWGYVISTVALWHTTYSINSVAHRIGTRRYDTPDTSRNNWLLGLLTLGEGWHNNHHHYCTATRQGFFWWEIDVTYYAIRLLQAVGIVWDVREPPAQVVRGKSAPDTERRAA
jgi:stearoyl-CoA desaturase (delta-9 desaturase)